MDKSLLVAALRDRIVQELQRLRESQSAAQQGAIHEETRQEDPKDTRAIESQYVARGLAERVEGLQGALAILARFELREFGPDESIGLSALVALQRDDVEKIYFLVPVAGGETLAVNGATVQTLTPASPLGQALHGKAIDDDVTLELPARRRVGRIAWVR